MYEQFYGLKENPFHITPDPKFLYLSETHETSLAHMLYGIERKRGLVVLTGETGTGKTTLINCIIERIKKHTRIAFLVNPRIDILDIYKHIFYKFGIQSHAVTKGEFLIAFNEFLVESANQAENVVLIIDEAQNLSHEFLEDLRLLSNFETHEEKLLQIILVGHPELDKKLNSPELAQIKQRIGVNHRLLSLTLQETKEYIVNRLRIAGTTAPIFSEEALHTVYTFSRGIPRVINVLCDLALFLGNADKVPEVQPALIKQAAESLDLHRTTEPHNAPASPVVRADVADDLIAKTSKNNMYLMFPEVFPDAQGIPDQSGMVPQRHPLKNRLLLILAIVVGLGLGMGVIQIWTQYRDTESPAEQEQVSMTVAGAPATPQASNRHGSEIMSEQNQPGEPWKVVLVQPGDSLTKILLREYGRFDATLLAHTQAANPDMRNPARLRIGQRILLPHIPE